MGLKKIVSGLLFPDTITVLGGVHGDETTGISVVTLLSATQKGPEHIPDHFTVEQRALAQRILNLVSISGKSLQHMIVNKEAVKHGYRYVHQDLNRTGTRGHLYNDSEPAPGLKVEPDSDIYEERLMFSLQESFSYGDAGVVIDIHSTTSSTLTSIILEGGEEKANLQLARSMEKAVNDSDVEGTMRVLKMEDGTKNGGYNRTLMTSLSKYCVAIEWGPVTHRDYSSNAVTGALTALYAAVDTICNETKTGPTDSFSYFYTNPAQSALLIPPGYTLNRTFMGQDFLPLSPTTSLFVHQDTNTPGTPLESTPHFSPGSVLAFIGEASYSESVNRAPDSPSPYSRIAAFSATEKTFTPYSFSSSTTPVRTFSINHRQP